MEVLELSDVSSVAGARPVPSRTVNIFLRDLVRLRVLLASFTC